ncbi:hypothetical protein POM88_049172 [Heracleum sosnowskyi]|uniref:Uncharacterized protein n=1 Tax=Heracleum sosnowskyi TaxID=360622 RepID=A0AAD8GXP7_9APIA|nr:hypothetical protein POM88_049172 [Heracleum sosnowskyi]
MSKQNSVLMAGDSSTWSEKESKGENLVTQPSEVHPMLSSQMGAQMSSAAGEVSQKLQMPAPMEQAPGPSTTSENLKSVTYDTCELIEAFRNFLPHPPKEDEASTLDDVIDYINTTHAEIPQLEERLAELQSQQQSVLTAGMQFEATATEGDYNIPDSPIFGLVEMPNQMVGTDVVPAIGSPVNHAAEAASALKQAAIVNQAAEAASVVNQAPNQAGPVMNQAAAVVNRPAVENPDAVGVTATMEELVAFGHCTVACDNVELMQERTKGCPVYSLDTCDDDDDFTEPVRNRVGEIQCVDHERDRAGVVNKGGKKVNKLKLQRNKCVIDISESANIAGVGTRSKKRRRDAKKRYRWAAEDGPAITTLFWEKCATRTKDNLSKERKKALQNAGADHPGSAVLYMHEYSPWWCSADVWTHMCEKLKEEDWIEKRNIASNNRFAGAPSADKAKGTYRGGSISQLHHIANKLHINDSGLFLQS